MTRKTFSTVALPGLTLDTLGLYFAALGLLRLLAKNWPSVRGCWREGVFTVVGESLSRAAIVNFLENLSVEELPAFEIEWKSQAEIAAKNSKAKSFNEELATAPLQKFRSQVQEDRLRNFDMHIVANLRVVGNPILKNPGGRRDPHSNWDAVIQDAFDGEAGRASLRAVLFDEFGSNVNLMKWNAGTWFPNANKIYNFSGFSSRNKSPSTDSGMPSWGLLLAVCGFEFLIGSTSRRMGVSAKGRAAFPFVTEAAGALSEGSCGGSEGEFWAPVWKNPRTVAELEILFARGKAEIGDRSATNPAKFAASIIGRGIDHGLAEFRRFEFKFSTGEKTFEAVQTARIQVAKARSSSLTEFVSRVCRFRDRLPAERKQGQKWRYQGLQGPLDRAVIDLAEAAGKDRRELLVERSGAVLDVMVRALAKVDRNRSHRAANVAFERLPLDWLAWLVKTDGTSAELRVALALASLKTEKRAKSSGSHKSSRICFPQAFLAYRFGAEPRGRTWIVPKDRPLRAIWSPLPLVDNLCALARRRLIESLPAGVAPFRSRFPAPLSDVVAFLQGETDDDLIARWLDRLSLFDWFDDDRPSRSSLDKALSTENVTWSERTAEASLYTFFRPLFDDCVFRALVTEKQRWERRDARDPLLASAARCRPVVAALEREDPPAAWTHARNALQAKQVPIADFPASGEFTASDPRRLLAALIVPAQNHGLYDYFTTHWKSPVQPRLEHSTP